MGAFLIKEYIDKGVQNACLDAKHDGRQRKQQ